MEGPALRPALRLIRKRVGSGGRAGQCWVGVRAAVARPEAEGGVPARSYDTVGCCVVGGHRRSALGGDGIPCVRDRLVTAPGPGDLPGLGGHGPGVVDGYVGVEAVAPATADGIRRRALGGSGARAAW